MYINANEEISYIAQFNFAFSLWIIDFKGREIYQVCQNWGLKQFYFACYMSLYMQLYMDNFDFLWVINNWKLWLKHLSFIAPIVDLTMTHKYHR